MPYCSFTIFSFVSYQLTIFLIHLVGLKQLIYVKRIFHFSFGIIYQNMFMILILIFPEMFDLFRCFIYVADKPGVDRACRFFKTNSERLKPRYILKFKKEETLKMNLWNGCATYCVPNKPLSELTSGKGLRYQQHLIAGVLCTDREI